MKVYGPYTRKDGRKHVVVYREDGVKTTISYPKYLMEQHLGRKLNKNETVDHVDRDFTNDALDNLQILDQPKHSSLDVLRVKKIRITCVWCGEECEKAGNKLRANEKQGKAGPFCGKSCAGKYSMELKHGRINKLNREKTPKAKYYKLSKGK